MTILLFSLVFPLISMSGDWQIILAVIPIIVGIVAALFENLKAWNNRFDQCSEKINHQDNEMEQLSAAVQLRSFFSKRKMLFFSHSRESINLTCAALHKRKPGRLQKTLGDSLSYVKRGHGLDLQEATLHFVSIKPKTRIEYEVFGRPRYNVRSIDIRGTDLYRADFSESSVHNVIFDKSLFIGTFLFGTTFRNCSFRGANFQDADLRGVKFEDCDLTGAFFKGAKQMDKCLVVSNKKNSEQEKIALEFFLNENGVFSQKKDKPVYIDEVRHKKIFLSKLGGMATRKKLDRMAIQQIFEQQYHFEFESIERSDYRETGQLWSIQDTMSYCSGVIVLAFAHMKVFAGEIRKPKEDRIVSLQDVLCPSPWLQIEAAFARSLDLPCLIIAEDDNLLRNGVFGESFVDSDENLFYVKYKDGVFSEEDRYKIEKWRDLVERKKPKAVKASDKSE